MNGPAMNGPVHTAFHQGSQLNGEELNEKAQYFFLPAYFIVLIFSSIRPGRLTIKILSLTFPLSHCTERLLDTITG